MTRGRALAPWVGRARMPAAVLVALLQRTPAVRMAAAASEAARAPIAAVARAAVAAAAALGAIDSVAGATTYTLSTGSPGHPSPYTVAEGSQVAAVAFALISNPTVTNPAESWTVMGQIPPGLSFGSPGGPTITSPGYVNLQNPFLFGTPTEAGSYTMVLQAWEYQGGTGLFSSTFTYEVIVTSNVTPTPTPTPNPNAPAFTTQPISATVAGGTVALDAVATKSPTYQWMLNGAPVSGATGPILLIPNAAAAAGTYACVATNPAGSTTSSAATVAIDNTPDIGRLVNISCRATVGTQANILIAGFVVGGAGTSGAEPLLLRGSGPALIPFGVLGTLPDPQLQLYSGPTLLGTNDAWGGSAQIASTAAAVGAFAWNSPASHDAALLEKLSAGAYTAQVAGESGDTGVALAEVYDATPAGAYTAAAARIVNISARVQVGTGGDILIAGFAIGGSTSRTVLVRASGPALVPFGVPGTLPDPLLQLYSGSTVILSNKGWGGNPQIASAASSVGAFQWSSPMSADSALLVTLPPGAYTAQVSGASGDTGVALVEVYEVP
ncbi:MAG: hypothetical protein ABSH26_10400 [Opitutaceae bacterium]